MFDVSGELKYEVFVPSYIWREYKTIKDYSNLTEAQQRALNEFEILRNAARNYCEYKYGAINRVGCYCCYGDGPNLEMREEVIKDEMGYDELDSLVIKCYIDFDFNASDYK